MSDDSRAWKDQYMLRLPEGMRDRLKAEAERNKRSMNAEIVARLERTFNIDASIAENEAHFKRGEMDFDRPTPTDEDYESRSAPPSEIERQISEAVNSAVRSVFRQRDIKTSSAEHPEGDPDEGE